MNTAHMTLEEIRQQGIDALAKELGPVGMIRFLQQFEIGKGDYSVERHQWLPSDVETIAAALASRSGKLEQTSNRSSDR